MDVTRLVESGKYKKEEIKSDYDKGIIKGFEWAQQELEAYLNIFDKPESKLEEIEMEIIQSAVQGAKDHLSIYRNELIVAMLDEQAAKEE